MISIIKNLKNTLAKPFHSVKNTASVETFEASNKRHKKDVRLSLPHMMMLLYLKAKFNIPMNTALKVAVKEYLELDNESLAEAESFMYSFEKHFPPSPYKWDRVSLILKKDDMDKLTEYVGKKGITYSLAIRTALTLFLSFNYGEIFNRYW